MRFSVAFAVLFASVAFLGATASRQGSVDVDDELEQVDILIELGKTEYSAITDAIRAGFESILEKIKARLGGTDFFDAIRDRFEDIQNRIRDLAKQGGIRFVHAIQEIRDKIQALVKRVFDLTNRPSGFYAAEDNSFGERLGEFVTSQLRNFRQRLEEAKELAHDLRENLTAFVKETQEEIAQLAKSKGQSAIKLYTALRQKIRDAFKQLKNQITGGSAYYAAEQGTFLDTLIDRIQELLERGVEKLKQKLVVSEELFEKFKGKIQDLQEKILELKEKSLVKVLEIANQIKQKIKDIAESISGRISTRSVYADEEESSLIDRLAAHLRELVQKALEALKGHIAKSKDIYDIFKTKLQELGQKLVEAGKEHGLKALEAVRGLRDSIKAIAREIAEKIGSGKALYSIEQDDEVEDDTLLGLVVKHLRELASRGLDRLKGLLEKSKVHFDEFKDRITELQAALVDLGKKTGEKAFQAVKDIRRKIQDLALKIADKLSEKKQGLYAAEDEGEGSLVKTLIQHIVDLVKDQLQVIQDRLAQHKDVFDAVKEKLADVRQKLADLAKQTGLKALDAVRALRQKVQDLVKNVLERISGGGKFYALTEEEPTLIERLVNKMKELISKGLEALKEKVAQSKELASEFLVKTEELTNRLADMAKLTGRKALDAARQIRNDFIELNIKILKRIAGNKETSTYALKDEDETNDGTLLERLIKRVRGLVEKTLDFIRERIEKQKELLGEFKDKVDEISRGLLELTKQTGRKALETVKDLHEKVVKLNMAILHKITGRS